MPSTYTLNAEEEEVARRLVESGRYASIAEVLRDGLRRIADEADELYGYDPAELKRLVEEGEASEMLEEDGEVTLERLRKRYRDMAAAARPRE